ncbi:helix-turn-helix domain-containing protein [Paenibacillus xylanexedens]|uniref:helix-turn-helix domain-containing protein n=1 Tax=Paenibacillus xylanexedens TaxID=528191 RepID=UPI0011A6CD44|nr:helix-turn-helix transcriptional regulator [Paenibacillus xylanexedens]
MLKVKIKIKEVLKQRNLTQKQLESMSGVSQARISKLTKEDRQEVNLEMLTRIAAALGITDISELIQFEEVPDIENEPTLK